MNKPFQWLRKHTFETHLIAFLVMTLPAIALYFAAQSNLPGVIWILIGIVIAGNLLVLVPD